MSASTDQSHRRERGADSAGGRSAFRIPRFASAAAPTLDSVTTIRADGAHFFLHPADAAGRFMRLRRVTAWLLIVIYLSLPWIRIGGYPAVFLDVAARRFHLFGLTLAAQDMWLLFFLISGLGFTLFFLTALLGRVWCGWACPQTVFLEHVYRRVERWIEGDAVARRRLDAAPWGPAKLFRRGLKQAIFLTLSLAIAHLFLAYFVSVPELWSMMRSAPLDHWSAFLFVFVFAGVLYFNFAWFREQLCIIICPYGRLQSALADDHTLVIGYDGRRGEPRGRHHRKPCRAGSPDPAGAAEAPANKTAPNGDSALQPPGLPADLSVEARRAESEALAKAGDCIDCHRCVQVCPTGIDIRQGLQIECIGCAACIDACDEIMARLRRPAGLVRYDSLNGLAGRPTRWVRPRTMLYLLLLFAGAAAAAWAFSTVRPAAMSVTRMTGASYFVDANTVRNQFLVRLVNKQDAPQRLAVVLRGMPPWVVRSGLDGPVDVAGLGEEVHPLVLVAPRGAYAGPFRFTVAVRDTAGAFELSREVEFLGPDRRLLEEEDHEKGVRR